MQQKIYTFTNISLFFEVMFLIPFSGQHIYIYAFTQMSNTYFVIFLILVVQSIYIATEDLQFTELQIFSKPLRLSFHFLL